METPDKHDAAGGQGPEGRLHAAPKLDQQGVEIAAPTTPEQFSALLQDGPARWARIVKATGAAVD